MDILSWPVSFIFETYIFFFLILSFNIIGIFSRSRISYSSSLLFLRYLNCFTILSNSRVYTKLKWINQIDFILKICCYGLKKYIRTEFVIKLVSRSSTILQGKMSLSLHLQPFRFSPLLALKQSSPLDIGSQWRESMARGSSICHSCFDESLKSTVSCNSDRRGANFCVP